MRVALINNLHVDHLGFYYIAAVARSGGNEPRLFLTDRQLERNLARFDPDVVCFTATTGNQGWVIDLVRELRPRFSHARYILGGPHATFYPEVARMGVFDAVVRGEGEESFADILSALRAGRPLGGIPGVWAWEEGRVIETPLREAPQDLDALPFPDRSIYDDYPWIQAHRYPMMITSRGCPFPCTFCYSPTMADLSKGLGKFVRFRSVDNVIAEAIELQRRYQPEIVEFVDDIFGMKRPWLREFAAKWHTSVGLRYNICIRADLIDEEAVELLASSGCNTLCMG